MTIRNTLNMICAAAAMTAIVGLAAMPAGAQDKGSMHVAFGDIPGPDMVNFMAAVARAEARGVSVEVTYLQSEDIAAQAIVGGQADIGVGTPYALIQKVNAPIRMFYQLSQLRFYPIVNSEMYQSWEDLDGADVAVHGRGSGTEAIMNLMAIEHGVEYNSVSYVPGSAVRAGALLQGRLNASIVDFERYQLLQREAPGKFIALPLPPIEASDEALYANTEWLEQESEAVEILLEELVGVWREINEDPNAVIAMRDQYDVMPDLEQEDVADILPSFTQGVEIDLYSNNGGGVASVIQDFEFYTSSGTLEGDPAALEVEDFWYLGPLNTVLDRVGRI